MKTLTVRFLNKPTATGLESFDVAGCLVYPNGSPNIARPQIAVHLPKSDNHDVDGAFIDYDGYWWHVVGTTARKQDANTPTSWNRYAIAERIRAL